MGSPKSKSMLAAIACLALTSHAGAQESKATATAPITPEQFEKVHKLIKPHPGESRWREPDPTSKGVERARIAAGGCSLSG